MGGLPFSGLTSAFGAWSENITFGGQTTSMACLVASVIVGIQAANLALVRAQMPVKICSGQ